MREKYDVFCINNQTDCYVRLECYSTKSASLDLFADAEVTAINSYFEVSVSSTLLINIFETTPLKNQRTVLKHKIFFLLLGY